MEDENVTKKVSQTKQIVKKKELSLNDKKIKEVEIKKHL